MRLQSIPEPTLHEKSKRIRINIQLSGEISIFFPSLFRVDPIRERNAFHLLSFWIDWLPLFAHHIACYIFRLASKWINNVSSTARNLFDWNRLNIVEKSCFHSFETRDTHTQNKAVPIAKHHTDPAPSSNRSFLFSFDLLQCESFDIFQ